MTEKSSGILDQIVAWCEQAWRAGKRPGIEEVLRSNPECDQHQLLIELVHLELEHRLSAGEPARVEEYLERYPDLTTDRQVVLGLIRSEYEMRRREEPRLEIGAYTKRFPWCHNFLPTELPASPRLGPGRVAVRLNCPHCQNPIEIVDDRQNGEDVICPSCGSSFHLDADRTQTWSKDRLPKLGKFELIEAVGRGAFGTVYRARDTQLQRIVAVKVPRSGQIATDDDEDRFVREARSAAQLQHAGIVPVFEVGRSETFPYIVSEFVDGVTLADTLTARKFTFRECAGLVAKIAAALQHAHDHGVVHRDLKPSNIMLTANGTPRVMDFGLAKRDAGEITMTIDGQVLGTPAYMSPEQASGQGHHVDGRSDVYSLGVLLFELLTGELPFRGNQRMLLHQVLHDEPRSPRSLNDRIPRDLETIAIKCLEKDPGRRYQSAHELAADLGRWFEGREIAARPIGRLARWARFAKRYPLPVSLATALTISLLGGVIISATFAVMTSRQRTIADAARSDAVARFAQARKSVDKWLTGASMALQFYPGMQQVRERLLEQAAVDYEEFVGTPSADSSMELERARALIRLGDVRHILAKTAEAATAYREAESLLSDMITHGFLSRDATLDRNVVRIKSALLLTDQGQTKEAGRVYSAIIAGLDQSLRSRPDDIRVREIMAVALLNKGDLERQASDIMSAVQSLAKAEECLQAIPPKARTAKCLLDLAIVERQLGQCSNDLGQSAEAEDHFRKALETLGELITNDSGNPVFLQAASSVRQEMATALRSLGKYDDELAAYRQAIADYKELDKTLPDVPIFRESIALCKLDLAQLLYHLGETKEARSELSEALACFVDLGKQHPEIPLHLQEESTCEDVLAQVLSDLNQTDEALAVTVHAAHGFKKLVENYDEPQYKQQAAICHAHLGQLLDKLGRGSEVQSEYEAALDGLNNDKSPEGINAGCIVMVSRAELLLADGDQEGAMAMLDEARCTWEKLVADLGLSEHRQQLAWLLINGPIPERYDPVAAIGAVEAAVESAPANARYRATLAAAYFRKGEFAKSLDQFAISARLHKHALPADSWFLAMAQWNSGQKQLALETLEEARRWTEDYMPGNRELRRLATEATRLIQPNTIDPRTSPGS